MIAKTHWTAGGDDYVDGVVLTGHRNFCQHCGRGLQSVAQGDYAWWEHADTASVHCVTTTATPAPMA